MQVVCVDLGTFEVSVACQQDQHGGQGFLVTAERGTVTGGALWMLGVLAKVWPVAPMAGLLLRRPGRLQLVIGSALTLAVR